jgi:hypothetical protein
MAAVSIASTHGLGFFKLSDFVTGTSAPTAGQDFEVRYNTTDQNGANISRLDLIVFLKGVQRALEQGGGTVDLIPLSGTTPPPPVT